MRLLSAEGLCCGYGPVTVAQDIRLEVNIGEVSVLLGPNGAGKTTVLRTLGGEIPPLSGCVLWQGEPMTGGPHIRARQGLGSVPAERGIFSRLSVRDNLRVARVEQSLVISLFPELEKCLKRKAGLLSGGEQQMLAIGRAIARKPRVLLVDELSLGLAPMIVHRLLGTVRAAADAGMGVVLVEQHLQHALEIADTAHVMSRGRIMLSASAADVNQRLDEIESLYFGAAAPITNGKPAAEPTVDKP